MGGLLQQRLLQAQKKSLVTQNQTNQSTPSTYQQLSPGITFIQRKLSDITEENGEMRMNTQDPDSPLSAQQQSSQLSKIGNEQINAQMDQSINDKMSNILNNNENINENRQIVKLDSDGIIIDKDIPQENMKEETNDKDDS
ncbi:MAG: hypothetical protein EZS28_052454 [Streblomastix strix]|uniref:Uncharacterized protein n=1 Tax=Streblomastix strix TaxID=222440 RepID=A0A5J4S5Z1_9EUKA|nr:MAG: hypothetical protein EZS28_052454 [Streblomastix strix]